MEKPFRCPMADCNLSFANEDHLTVHKKKHELSLSLTPTPTFKNIFDQTPTPTRFLKALEEEFENENPFDATFRRANSIGASSTISIPESSSLIASLPESEVLNTPSIILPSEPATPLCLKPHFPRILSVRSCNNPVSAVSTDSLPFTPSEPSLADSGYQEDISDANFPPKDIKLELSRRDACAQRTDVSKNVLKTSVITSVGNSNMLKSFAPTTVVVTRPPVNNVSTLSSSQVTVVTPQNNQCKVQEATSTVVQQPLCVAPVVQLMIRLPDGQTVQLPVVASVPTTQPSQTVTSIAPQVTSTTSNAKTKLKEVLTLNQKSARKSQKAKHKQSVHILTDDCYDLNDSPPLSPLPTLKSAHHGRKRRDHLDNPDEKRKKSLERNRAAATRCREKRKMWITALESKADELAHVNTQLQGEVNQLRNEVAQLKTMLLAHKDCPVTMQQRANQYDTGKETYTTIRIITSAPEDNQRVPNCAAVSPLNSDYMEMEVSSVQSSSDASLTSDTSDTLSYRER